MVSKPYLQHGFNMVAINGPMRENMLKLINMGYLNNILYITYSKSLHNSAQLKIFRHGIATDM